MNKENPQRFNLRYTTYEIIQQLKEEKSVSEATACRIFYNSVRQKHADCGFKLDNFQRFYNCYRQFKRTLS